MEVQVRVVAGCFSWVAHGSGRRRAISRSNRRNKMATEEESDGEWETGGSKGIEPTFVGG